MTHNAPYTVKQVAAFSGVSTRTLRYYDQIGLLKPAFVGENGYRYYDDESLLRLQQILFFRELGVPLKQIAAILDRPGFDRVAALEQHRAELEQRARRLAGLIHTIDKTIAHLKGEHTMSNEELFEEFSPEQQAKYEQEARETWGDAAVDATNQRWNSYTQAQQEAIKAQQNAIFAAFRDHMHAGHDAPAVQEQVAALQKNMAHFYPCPLDCLRGLGQMYVEHADFRATFERIAPGLADFIQRAINYYCDQHTES